LTDWLAACRAAVEDVRGVFGDLPGRAEREPVVGDGVGGDETTAVDEAAERVVVARLEATGASFTLVSEELGEKEVGGGGPPWLVVDPIDGSLNAKRGLPHFALSIAVADGPTMADVRFGFVYDFGWDEEWTVAAGEDGRLNGEPLGPQRPKDTIEVLSFEATLTSSVAEQAASMVDVAYRIRILGSLALSLCQLAAGRLDGVVSLKPIRSVDVAAAQLLIRERGLAVELVDEPPLLDAPLDLIPRSRIAAAGTPELCTRLAQALSA
jgi:myo-inositol-1(or 4)-monophosphatase